MRLSEGVEWSLHACLLLAALPEGISLPVRDLAEYNGVSDSYLVKHLKALAKAGVLASVPGPKGGFRLARPADRITVLDVVQGVEGAQSAFRCTEIRRRGPAGLEAAAYPLPCHITATMLQAERAWARVLRSQTLAQLVENVVRTTDPRAVERTMGWLQGRVR